MRNFFKTFFGLPTRLSAGFLSNDLSSVQLLQFAFMCFVQGNNALRALLLTHLVSAGAGVRLGQAYAYPLLKAAGVASVVDGTGWAAAGEAAANVSFVTKILAWSVRALAMNTGQVSPPRTLGTPCSSVYATCSVDGL